MGFVLNKWMYVQDLTIDHLLCLHVTTTRYFTMSSYYLVYS